MMPLNQLPLLPLLFVLTATHLAPGDPQRPMLDRKPGSSLLFTCHNQNEKNMGISINLYRVGKAEKLEDLKGLEDQISQRADTKVDLYQITGDLAVIFLNSTNPFNNTNTIPYKMLYGRRAEKSVSVGEIGGFLPSSEITEITKWIKDRQIQTFDGFSKIYDNLSPEVKKLLEEMGTDDKASLFNGYVRPLAVLYFTALENQNSILFIGQ
jgi:hypothetical protein